MSAFETIKVEQLHGVMTMTLARPSALNAFKVQMLRDMIAAFDLADAADSVGAVAVTGARAFCAGADPVCRGGTVRPCDCP